MNTMKPKYFIKEDFEVPRYKLKYERKYEIPRLPFLTIRVRSNVYFFVNKLSNKLQNCQLSVLLDLKGLGSGLDKDDHV